jgi:hypothetical protein
MTMFIFAVGSESFAKIIYISSVHAVRGSLGQRKLRQGSKLRLLYVQTQQQRQITAKLSQQYHTYVFNNND